MACYIYAYQLRCTKQAVLMALKSFLLLSPPLQNQPSMAVCNSAGIHAVCGCTINRALRTTKLLPKVVICINITLHTLSTSQHIFILRLRRSLATSALYAAVRIHAERFCVIGTKFPITQKIPQ